MQYGAAAGLTDGGFGDFDTQWDAVFLLANNTINWDSVYMFGYKAIHEMTVLGKSFTAKFYSTNSTKIYTYYQACSEGGREGFSQVQRFPETYDGAIIGAPALRYSFQQVNHLYSNVQQQTLGYYHPLASTKRFSTRLWLSATPSMERPTALYPAQTSASCNST
jgi:tannase